MVEPRDSVAALIPALRRPEKALREQIEVSTANHLAFEPLQAIALAFHRPRTPRQGHPSLHRFIVFTTPGGEALKPSQRTRDRPCQPGIESNGGPLAHHLGNVLCEGAGFRARCMLRLELHEYRRIVWRSPRRAPEDEPGRLADHERRLPSLRDDRQRPLASPLPWGQPLRLPQTLGVARHGDVAARIPLVCDLANELSGVMAAIMPASEPVRLSGGEQAPPPLAPSFAFRKRRRVAGATHRAPPPPELAGHGRAGAALVPQGPDRRVECHPLCPAPGGFGLDQGRGEWPWDRRDDRPVVGGHHRLAPDLIDRLEGGALSTAHVLQGRREVLEQRNASGHWGGGGCPRSDPTGVSFRPVAGDHLAPRMRPEPCSSGLRRTIRQHGDGAVALQSTQHRAVGLPLPERTVVHAEDLRRRQRRERPPADRAPQGLATHGDAESLAEPPTGRSAQCHADLRQPCRQAWRPSRPGGHERCQPRSKDAACATTIRTAELPHLQVEHDAPRATGQLRQGADIATVDPPRRQPADRTMDQRLGSTSPATSAGWWCRPSARRRGAAGLHRETHECKVSRIPLASRARQAPFFNSYTPWVAMEKVITNSGQEP